MELQSSSTYVTFCYLFFSLVKLLLLNLLMVRIQQRRWLMGMCSFEIHWKIDQKRFSCLKKDASKKEILVCLKRSSCQWFLWNSKKMWISSLTKSLFMLCIWTCCDAFPVIFVGVTVMAMWLVEHLVKLVVLFATFKEDVLNQLASFVKHLLNHTGWKGMIVLSVIEFYWPRHGSNELVCVSVMLKKFFWLFCMMCRFHHVLSFWMLSM